MNMELILNYLSELSRNNNREWYHEHKEEYREANAEFESLIQELILRIGEMTAASLGIFLKNSHSNWSGTLGSAVISLRIIPVSALTFH